MNKFSLLIPNSVGLISKITKEIYNKQGNIMKSNMIKTGEYFHIDLEVNNISKASVNELIEKYNYKSNGDYDKKINTYELNIILSSADNPGIIHYITNNLSIIGIDIYKLNSNTQSAAFGGTTLFSLDAKCHVPNNITKEMILNTLDINVVKKFGCDLTIN